MCETDTLLVGATAYAVGYAIGNPNCMIIEEGQWAGADFSSSLNAEPVDLRAVYTPQTRELLKDLRTRGLVDSYGRVHILPIAAKFSEELLRSKAGVWFDATLIGAKEEGCGYSVTVFHRNGFECVRAKRVIDTRACVCLDGAKKFLCTAITPVEGKTVFSGARVLTGALEENILKLYLDRATDYTSARRKTEEWIRKNLNGAKIYAFANAFGYDYASVCKKRKRKGYKEIASLSFGDILSAFDGGVKAGVTDGKSRI